MRLIREPRICWAAGCNTLSTHSLNDAARRQFIVGGGLNSTLSAPPTLRNASGAGVPHRPGIVELLDWLEARDIPRAVATSTKRPLALRKLRAARLLDRFDAVCTSSDVAQPKPAPDVYLLAAERLGVAPADCLVLEDSPTGVRAALAAGMTPVQVPDMLLPDGEVRALRHRIVGSLGEAQRLLEASLAPA